MKSKIFIPSIFLISTVNAQVDSIGCFVPGECVQSHSLAFNGTSDPWQCLEFCQVVTNFVAILYTIFIFSIYLLLNFFRNLSPARISPITMIVVHALLGIFVHHLVPHQVASTAHQEILLVRHCAVLSLDSVMDFRCCPDCHIQLCKSND